MPPPVSLTHCVPQVLCVGEILVDLLADQPGSILDVIRSWTPYPGGAPANVACGLVKLGTPAAFIGCVGVDGPGQQLLAFLQAHQVNVTGVQRHAHAPTRRVYVTHSEAGDRTFAGFGDDAPRTFADTQLQAADLPEALFHSADYLVLGTLELAYPDSAQALHRALKLAQQYQVKVALDVNWRSAFWSDPIQAKSTILDIIPQAHYLKLSHEEADWLFETGDPTTIADRLPHAQGVLVTAGAKGCAYSLGAHVGQVPAFAVKGVDTTGAGDAFLAGFLHQLCAQGETCLSTAAAIAATVTYANAVGALTVTQLGAIAAQPTSAEVAAFLANPPTLLSLPCSRSSDETSSVYKPHP